ncbi:MAG: Kelch repeat-containing protein [Gaiellaceae bacterium]
MRRLALLALAASLLTGAAAGAVGPGRVAPTRDMTAARACHSATLLQNGRVLIAAGFEREDDYVLRAEVYDPRSGRFRSTGTMPEPRLCHTATRLRDGRVLLAGGSTREWLASAELYDPRTGRFAATASLSVRRGGATATLLADGRVLVAGGFDGKTHATAELYDPATETSAPTGTLATARSNHTATLLRNGRVLVTGGRGATGAILRSAELYDPAAGTFSPAGRLTVPRHKHGATLLRGGKVLVIGGANARDWRGRYRSAEVYDAGSGRFSPAGRMASARFKLGDAVALLASGRVLVAGGATSVETFDAGSRSFRAVPGRLDADRFYTTATALPDGSALIAGGYDSGIEATARAWRYRP